MADPKRRLEANAPGDFFVDSSCIDCDLCRQIAPSVFRAEGDNSVVHHQPADAAERLRATMALVTCPTASIGTRSKPDLAPAIAALPERIEGGVHFCGFASPDSFGGSSYLIVRPDGNVLVDSPRFSEPLVKRVAALGGLRSIFLTHQDDIADHARWASRFGAERIMHVDDAPFAPERPIDGREPVRLADDLLVIPTPGHTAGHLALLHEDRFLFSGDHVWGDGEGGLSASRRYNWHSWDEQRRSMQRLLEFRFEWILPGHGPRHHAAPEEQRRALERLIDWMS